MSPISVSYASEYYIWLAIGAPLVVFSFVPSNFLRSTGLSRESMIGSISGTVVNIILNPIMISVWGLGATGAAVATVLGYVVTDVYFLYLMLRRCPQFSLRSGEAVILLRYVGQIMGIGIPAAVTNLTTSLSMVLTNQDLLPFGNEKIAAMGIVSKVVQGAALFLVGFSFGAQPIIGYLYGAGNRERLRQLTGFSFRFLLSLGAVLGRPSLPPPSG